MEQLNQVILLLQKQHQEQTSVLMQQMALMTNRTQVSVFPPYNKEQEDWYLYVQRFEQHMEANQVTDEAQKRAHFLAGVGEENFLLIKKICTDEDPTTMGFKQLKAKISSHFEKKVHIVTSRYKFFQTRMKAGQTHAEWVAELQGLAKLCRFQCSEAQCKTSYAESLIRDMIILHTPNNHIRNEAIKTEDPSLEQVARIATMYEMEQNLTREMQSQLQVNKVSHTTNGKNTKLNPNLKKFKSCDKCYVNHNRSNCKFREAKCNFCNLKGHIQSVCLKKARNSSTNTHQRKSAKKWKKDSTEEMEIGNINEIIKADDNKKIYIKLETNGREIRFQMDTGSTASLINLTTYQQLGSPQCNNLHAKLHTYNGEKIPIKGTVTLNVKYKNICRSVTLIVVNLHNVSNIFGMDALNAFGFTVNDNVNTVLTFNEGELVEKVCREFPEVFSQELGKCETFKAHITLNEGAQPKFCKARPVPYSLHAQVKQELQRWQEQGVIQPINNSKWATPVVVVKKPNGNIRICGDFKITLNPQMIVDKYPMPRPEELFSQLQGEYFTKIDLSEAYLQLQLDEESKKYVVINTINGLYQFQRLAYGIASSPAIFQRFLEQITNKIPNCVNFLDDIIVTGRNTAEHIENLKSLLALLKNNGLTCNLAKCEFFKSSVTYLGHILDKDGIRPTQQNVDAIVKMPEPKNVKQLSSFLGKMAYYSKFIKNGASIAAPLNSLKKKNVKFVWSDKCKAAFNKLKTAIINATKLTHYVPGQQLILATDASRDGIGAVLSTRTAQGNEMPIAFASKTLNDAQKNYAQIELEALSIIYGIKKFHQYLYGNTFELITDHKPLTTLFNPTKGTSERTSTKLKRWSILLSEYNYKIVYRSTTHHANADALWRLPAGPDLEFDTAAETCSYLDDEASEYLCRLPIDAAKVATETLKDKILHQVRKYIDIGWPINNVNKIPNELKPFLQCKDSFSIMSGVILYHSEESVRAVIPKTLQNEVLKLLHAGHWGISRTKQIARRYVYWPGLDKDLENLINSCSTCRENQAKPPQYFKPWPTAIEPWQRIHVDYAGPFHGSMWLIVVDSYSQYPYVAETNSTTAQSTIKLLTKIFVIEGLPQVMVTDNGPQFASLLFQKFCKENGIQHLRTAPFEPQSNGSAERFVRTFKTAMNKALASGSTKEVALQRLLISYRTTPTGISSKSPAEKLHGRQPRTLLALLLPKKHCKQMDPTKFKPQDKVYIETFKSYPKWKAAIVQKCIGNRMYKVCAEGGITRRHQNQMTKRWNSHPIDNNANERVIHASHNPWHMLQQTSAAEPAARNDRATMSQQVPETTLQQRAAAAPNATTTSEPSPTSAATMPQQWPMRATPTATATPEPSPASAATMPQPWPMGATFTAATSPEPIPGPSSVTTQQVPQPAPALSPTVESNQPMVLRSSSKRREHPYAHERRRRRHKGRSPTISPSSRV